MVRVRVVLLVVVLAAAAALLPAAAGAATWSLMTTVEPPGSTGSWLDAVSCTSTTSCTAVGARDTATTTTAMIEAWNGSSWTVQPPASLPAISSELRGVSCTTSPSCVVVGLYTTGSGVHPLAERWTGTAWAVSTVASPSGATWSRFADVSCTSGTSCVAVGDSDANVNGTLMVQRWNGASWAVQSAPSPAGALSSRLDGVSCTSSTACVAVGAYEDGVTGQIRAMAMSWNGASWTMHTIADPASGGSSGLASVSCTSSTVCTAVGTYDNPATATQDTLVERWTSGRWAPQVNANPVTFQSGGLSGVSCTAATACSAVGWMYDGVGDLLTLAKRWDGTRWTAEDPPEPTGSLGSILYGVSCQSAICVGAGAHIDRSSLVRTLGELYS